jgi:hypothetical protein
METNPSELKQIATQILTGLLANPHLYPMYSDEMARGQKEQDLIILALEMAEQLIKRAEQ